MSQFDLVLATARSHTPNILNSIHSGLCLNFVCVYCGLYKACCFSLKLMAIIDTRYSITMTFLFGMFWLMPRLCSL